MAYRRYPRYVRKTLARAKRARERRRTLQTVRRALYGPRGESASLAAFGASRDVASPEQLANRRTWRFNGKGKYSVKKFVSDVGVLGEGIRKTWNAWIPKSIRDQSTGIVEHALGTIPGGGRGLYTGRGAYEANELVSGGQPPVTYGASNDETGSIVIRNREYITDVYGPSSSSFTNSTLAINPGLQQNFPWLSQIASNFSEYEFIQLLFIYKATIDIGNANTTGQSGTIIMACDYNASHTAMKSKEQMMQYHGSVSGKCTDDIVCGIECDPVKNPTLANNIRLFPVPYGEDPKTYDLGLFQFAINNVPAAMYNIQLGELWVEYAVRLRVPKLVVTRGFSQQMDQFFSGSAPSHSGTGAQGITLGWLYSPLGDISKLLHASNSNLGCRISYSNPNQTGTYPVVGDQAVGSAVWYSPYAKLFGGAHTNIIANASTYAWIESYPNISDVCNLTATSRLVIQFPAQFNGVLEITLDMPIKEISAATPSHAQFMHPYELYSGNVRPYLGYRSGFLPPIGWDETLGYWAKYNMNPVNSSYSHLHGGIHITLLVEVNSATAGINNQLMFDTTRWFTSKASEFASTSVAISSATLSIKEYNPGFSMDDVDYPQLKNPRGIVVDDVEV